MWHMQWTDNRSSWSTISDQIQHLGGICTWTLFPSWLLNIYIWIETSSLQVFHLFWKAFCWLRYLTLWTHHMFHVLKSLQLNKNSLSLKNSSKLDPDVLAAFHSATHVFGYLPANDSRQQTVSNKNKDLISSRKRHVCFRCNGAPARPVEPLERGLGPCVPSQDEEALVGAGDVVNILVAISHVL